MGWFSDIVQSASEAYQARQDALGTEATAEAETAKPKINWTIVGGIAVAALVLLLVLMRRK